MTEWTGDAEDGGGNADKWKADKEWNILCLLGLLTLGL